MTIYAAVTKAQLDHWFYESLHLSREGAQKWADDYNKKYQQTTKAKVIEVEVLP